MDIRVVRNLVQSRDKLKLERNTEGKRDVKSNLFYARTLISLFYNSNYIFNVHYVIRN